MAFNRNLKTSFADGNLYDLARKDYPPELFKDIIRITQPNKRARILDIGCGTGKSCDYFIRKSYNLLGIDLSKNMVKIAKEKFSRYENARFKICSFEKVRLPKIFLI